MVFEVVWKMNLQGGGQFVPPLCKFIVRNMSVYCPIPLEPFTELL